MLPAPNQPAEMVINLHDNFPVLTARDPMMVSLGCHVLGAAPPHPDNRDPVTMLMGVTKRIAAKLPEPKQERLVKLAAFARSWLEKHMTPLTNADDLSFDTWILEKNYPQTRKEELRRIYDAMYDKEKYLRRKVKCFMKDETYKEFKHGRGIFSTEDGFKVLFGPLCAEIEKKLYQYPAFIKHIPVADRPRYIMEYLLRGKAQESDYTSFESSFSPEVMGALDFVMFQFFTEHLSDSIYSKLFRSLAKTNHCTFKWFTLLIKARRMSGEMNTSLSNGFANLMVMLFLFDEMGLPDIPMTVEGDDGLVVSPDKRMPTSEQFAELGFNVKLVQSDSISEASFCGLIFDEEDLINITDPIKILLNMGWGTAKYARARRPKLLDLLRCKGLSMLCQYPGCPVVQAAALYILRMTRGRDVRKFVAENRFIGHWQRQLYLEALSIPWQKRVRPVPLNTRLLMEKKFGVTVEQQLLVERYFDNLNVLEPLCIPSIDYPLDCVIYSRRFVGYEFDLLSERINDERVWKLVGLGKPTNWSPA